MGHPPRQEFLGGLLGAFSLVLFIRTPSLEGERVGERGRGCNRMGGRDEDEEGEQEDGGA